jgi:hypothetical protein
MSPKLAAVAVVLALATAERGARAEPCRARVPEAGVPARTVVGPAGLGSPAEACAANDISLQGFASALIAVEDFYGGLGAGLTARARFVLGPEHWLSVWVPGLEYRFLANATIEAESAGMGAGAIGYHRALALGKDAQLAPFARMLLPTESVYQNAVRYGFDHGVSAVVRAEPWLELVGGAAFPLYVTVGSGSYHLSYQPNFAAEAIAAPFTFLAVAGGLGLRMRAGDDSALESFDPRLAVRVYPFRGARLEAAALLPLWGADRTDLVLGVNLGWIFEDE